MAVAFAAGFGGSESIEKTFPDEEELRRIEGPKWWDPLDQPDE